MNETETVKVFCFHISELFSQIRTCCETLPDKKVVEKVLRSLPPKFDHIAAVNEESEDLSKLSLVELTGSLQPHEQRANRTQKQPLEQAFQSQLNLAHKAQNQERENDYKGS